ncbi:MAG: peptidase M14 [Polaromonas sp.]|nr:peptidase M14 [Polaromonas sp.]
MPTRLNAALPGDDRSPRTSRSALLTLPLTALLLSACTSTPLPPWVPTSMNTTLPAGTTRPGAAPSPSSPVSIAQSFPVPAASLGAAPVLMPSIPLMPYSAAVAARFPPPSVIYSTPGLQPGRSNFSSPAEVSTWLLAQASAARRVAGVAPVAAAMVSIGRSQRGEPLQALVLTRAAATDPASLLATGRPTVLLVGQQGDEAPAATESLMVMASELAQGLLRPSLEKINVVVVPNANPDATRGMPASSTLAPFTGTDHLALVTPESQALAALIRDYRPTVVVDVREYEAGGRPVNRFMDKFGVVPKFDALFQYATTANTPELLTRASEEWFRRPLLAALKHQGLSVEWVHTTSADVADKRVSMGGAQPDSLRNVSALKNAIGLQLESRGAGLGRQHIQRRVHTQVTALSSLLGSTVQRAGDLEQLRPFFDREVAALACTGQTVVLATPVAAQYDLQVLDATTGADKTLVVDWESTLALNRLTVRARPCGYWLSAASGLAVDRLLMHGVKVMQLADAGAVLADSFKNAAAPSSGSVTLTRGLVDTPRGSYYVSLNQPLGNLVVAALEPDTPFSFFSQRVVPDLTAVARVMTPPVMKLQDMP